ncbi:MAG: NUDIX domain-containing protein [Bacteroidia bacterium]|nr:NUDIX domain-containing protein [Bacteroidia bacterium]
MIKVFFGNKRIYLIDSKSDYKANKSAILEHVNSKEMLEKVFAKFMDEQLLDELYILGDKKNQVYNWFSSLFKNIAAAGGLVSNGNEEWLFIFRNGKWDLPKGKIEKNEKIEEAAIREVEEECGIAKLKIVKALNDTYHIYYLEEKLVLKKTYWFEMICKDESALVPQLEEGITDVKWLKKKDLKQVVANTYESIIDVIQAIK